MADRLGHDVRLVGGLVHLDAHRQVGRDGGHQRVEFGPEGLDVLALPHRDLKPDRLLPVEAEKGLGRIGVAAPDRRHVRQVEEAVADPQVHLGDGAGVVELAADPDEDQLGPRLDHPGSRDRVLLRQRVQHLLLVQAERGQPRGRELKVHDLVALA